MVLPSIRRERRRMFRKLPFGAVPGYAPLCMDSNDPETVECAFKQRLLRDVPTPSAARLARLRDFVHDFLVAHVPRAREMTYEEWRAGLSFGEERLRQLDKAHDELRGGRPSKRAASHIDTFVKSEFYPTWKHARMINSRSDAFKVFSGPFFKAIEEVVYELKPFIKHIPVPERPNVIRQMKYAGRRYYATDFTAFESHFSREVMESVECQLYRHCLSWSSHADFIAKTLVGLNRMRTRTGIRASVEARRMSGDMCTSLGNGFTNLMLASFLVHEKGGTLEGFVEGDDGLFATDVQLTSQDYEELGFTIKIEEVDDPMAASFCGMIFSDSGEIIREPRRVFMGFGWTQSFINAGPKVMAELLRAKALSSVYETPQCPIVGELARQALLRTRGVRPRFVDDGYHRPHDEIPVPEFCPADDTRSLFAQVFGISVDVQLAAERAIRSGDMLALSSLVPPTPEQAEYSSKYVVVT